MITKGCEEDAAVQFRGLPYKATIADIEAFLGPHQEGLVDENPIQIILNHDGRASGFAKVQFASPAQAVAAREVLHGKEMHMPFSDEPTRYIEVFAYSERTKKLRLKKSGRSCAIV